MSKDELSIEDRNCIIYADKDPQYILIQPVDDHDIEVLDQEAEEIARGMDAPFLMAAFKINDWNRELSPWEAPAAFGKEDFGAGAGDTLKYVAEKLIPAIREKYAVDESIPVIIGGYSLAGFFALWSVYQKDIFAAVMAASPSVWLDGWTEYAESNLPLTKHVYLSLGDKEEKTRNKRMAQVGDAIREQEILLKSQGINCTLEWNSGNHFQEPDHRCARGFIWCMGAISEN